ncbi:MAG TPA: hypothetical protein VFJ60_08760 [Gaiella sp.]|nr:hypothetical protein [Gaiella sp.]
MCRATVDDRPDVRRVWWLTAEYLDPPGSFQDELHVELVDPPGPDGMSAEFFRRFEWTQPVAGASFHWTFPPLPFLPSVRAVAELVAERRPV